jgi:DNA-binding XRE family transcriptional regulator
LVEIDTRELRKCRGRALLTRAELHQKSGVSESTISKLEVERSGERLVRLETAKRLASALGVKPHDLVIRVPELTGSRAS